MFRSLVSSHSNRVIGTFGQLHSLHIKGAEGKEHLTFVCSFSILAMRGKLVTAHFLNASMYLLMSNFNDIFPFSCLPTATDSKV